MDAHLRPVLLEGETERGVLHEVSYEFVFPQMRFIATDHAALLCV